MQVFCLVTQGRVVSVYNTLTEAQNTASKLITDCDIAEMTLQQAQSWLGSAEQGWNQTNSLACNDHNPWFEQTMCALTLGHTGPHNCLKNGQSYSWTARCTEYAPNGLGQCEEVLHPGCVEHKTKQGYFWITPPKINPHKVSDFMRGFVGGRMTLWPNVTTSFVFPKCGILESFTIMHANQPPKHSDTPNILIDYISVNYGMGLIITSNTWDSFAQLARIRGENPSRGMGLIVECGGTNLQLANVDITAHFCPSPELQTLQELQIWMKVRDFIA
jgi:hypothetical protein